jgi:hypothetical protein
MGENRSLDEFFAASSGSDDPDGSGETDDDEEGRVEAAGETDEVVAAADGAETDSNGNTGGRADEAPIGIDPDERAVVADETTAAMERDASVGVLDTEAPAEGATADGTETVGVADCNAVDPLRTTYRWSPDGDDCPACGARVERRWRDGERFVCADCKEW